MWLPLPAVEDDYSLVLNCVMMQRCQYKVPGFWIAHKHQDTQIFLTRWWKLKTRTTKNKTPIGSSRKAAAKGNDVRFLVFCGLIAGLITVLYWYHGGKSMFVIPTILCIALAMRNFRKRNLKYFTNGKRALSVRHLKGSRGSINWSIEVLKLKK